MKLYAYYLIDPEIVNKLWERGVLEPITNYHIPDSKPILYAATTNKRLAKKFEHCRNMNCFKKIVKDIPKEEAEIDSWAIRISEKSLLFDNHKHIVIPLTGGEEWCADNATEIVIDNIKKMTFINPLVFCDDIQLALIQIGYLEEFLNQCPMYEYDANAAISERFNGAQLVIEGTQDWQNELGMFLWMFNEVVDAGGILVEGEMDDESLETVRRYKDTI